MMSFFFRWEPERRLLFDVRLPPRLQERPAFSDLRMRMQNMALQVEMLDSW